MIVKRLGVVGSGIMGAGIAECAARTGDPNYAPVPSLRRMVAAGWLGRKSGRGFYHYR